MKIKTPEIAIVGQGNVGTHLFQALKDHADVTSVKARTLEGLPSHSDIILVSVKDDAIAGVAARLRGRADLIAHTSGSIPMKVLDNCAPLIGVLYPMQTFTKDVPLDYSSIPVFIEGNNEDAAMTLSRVAGFFTGKISPADSEARKRLHLAAVFTCNFANALCSMAETVLKPSGIDIKAMLPLLTQTVEKLNHVSPIEAQTGPAARGDNTVIETHLKMLDNNPELQEIYRRISRYIEKQKHSI